MYTVSILPSNLFTNRHLNAASGTFVCCDSFSTEASVHSDWGPIAGWRLHSLSRQTQTKSHKMCVRRNKNHIKAFFRIHLHQLH